MQKFGPSWMDKVPFCGGIRVDGLTGVGGSTKVDEAKRDLTNGLEWVIDHYGLVEVLAILSDQGDVAKFEHIATVALTRLILVRIVVFFFF
jgi:hypothetical protein